MEAIDLKTLSVSERIHLFRGSVGTGILVSGGRGLLIDPCDSMTPDDVSALGVEHVDWILATQHRRHHTGGIPLWLERGACLAVSKQESALFRDPGAYWNDPRNRWRVYHSNPGFLVPLEPMRVSRELTDGDVIEWEGFRITALSTPGPTRGSMSLLVEDRGVRIVFAGGLMSDAGRVSDVWSLQDGCGLVQDYHGFMGRWPQWRDSLRRIADLGCDFIATCSARVFPNAAEVCLQTVRNGDRMAAAYAYASDINHYFPDAMAVMFSGHERMPFLATAPNPPFVQDPGGTSRLLLSDTGSGLLVDSGSQIPLERIREWIIQGRLRRVDAIWITHYHDDHVETVEQARKMFGCPVWAEEHVAEVLEAPFSYGNLPCLLPLRIRIDRRLGNGETWPWREFVLTAYHFPGQTYYHGGLLAEGHGMKVFFAGDSLGRGGFDDHCPANRTMAGRGLGSEACLDILENAAPHLVYNQHQQQPVVMTPDILAGLRQALARRREALRAFVAWEEPDFGFDENWISVRPYQVKLASEPPGDHRVEVEVWARNYGAHAQDMRVTAVAPAAWKHSAPLASARGLIRAGREECVALAFDVPPGVARGLHRIPLRIWWSDRYLGQWRHFEIEGGFPG